MAFSQYLNFKIGPLYYYLNKKGNHLLSLNVMDGYEFLPGLDLPTWLTAETWKLYTVYGCKFSIV